MILLAIAFFITFMFLYWKFTKRYVKNIHGKKMFNQWGTKMFYWTGNIMISGLLTVSTLLLLK